MKSIDSLRGSRNGGGTEAGRLSRCQWTCRKRWYCWWSSSCPAATSTGTRVGERWDRTYGGGCTSCKSSRAWTLRQQVSPISQGSTCLGRETAMSRIPAKGKIDHVFTSILTMKQILFWDSPLLRGNLL